MKFNDMLAPLAYNGVGTIAGSAEQRHVPNRCGVVIFG